jgi:type 2 lantibiotic biosynthesis protein LanM
MEEFFERFALRAATIDELLNRDAFDVATGQKTDADLAARRLAAWCRSCASGDWALFSKRLAKDGLTFDHVLPRLSTVRSNPAAPLPAWITDAQWIEAALKKPSNDQTILWLHSAGAPLAFEHLLAPVVEAARQRLWAGLPQGAAYNLTETAVAGLCHSLAQRLSELAAPALYIRLVSSMSPAKESGRSPAEAGNRTEELPSTEYNHFIADMRVGGFRQLFEAKPVLLRLLASVTRQWIETTQEFIRRLYIDLPNIREQLLRPAHDSLVTDVTGGLGDLHNSGHSVQLVRFADGNKILYKPKDLRLDALWTRVVDHLNSCAPIDLRAPRVVAGDGYGWSEFIEHTECSDSRGFERFFRRAGAWLCLFHIFVGTDMHEENMIAAGDHPVPIDLETILQAAEEGDGIAIAERHAFELAGRKIADSVIITGLLPAYGRSPENTVFGHGGLHNPQNQTPERTWENINTDAMKPVESWKNETGFKNIPLFDGQQARLGDFIDVLVAGYEAYADFISGYRETTAGAALFDGFSGLPARRLLRPTRFYALLLERLKDHRNMADGAEWSTHLDFITRLMDWDKPVDPWWPLLKAERVALAELNVPLFVSPTDTDEIADATGVTTRTGALPGLRRAQARFEKFDQEEVAWQSEVVRLSTSTVLRSDSSQAVPPEQIPSPDLRPSSAPDKAVFVERAAQITQHLSRLAIRSGPGVAWIGLDWLRDSIVCQLAPLGADFYNGAPGVCVFLAAHAKLTGDESAAHLALAGVSALRHDLRSVNAARFARALGVGGSTGLGSVVYAFTVLSELLDNSDLLADAKNAASLFTSDLIAADRSFDVMEGSAGAILALLKLYRVTKDRDVLGRAMQCGEHLLKQRVAGPGGGKAWTGWGAGPQLNGMSHGAAGYAYALTALAAATGRNEFAHIAQECIEFENTSFSSSRDNWPDFRREDIENDAFWPCQWCHGAGGIGLARMGTLIRSRNGGEQVWTGNVTGDFLSPPRNDPSQELLQRDIRRAVDCVEKAWPYPFDTLCCGSLGNIELLNEAARCFVGQERANLRDEAARRMMAIITAADARGDYRWDVGDRRFNLGLFRGLAGVGYTLLRQLDRDLPNVLIWE